MRSGRRTRRSTLVSGRAWVGVAGRGLALGLGSGVSARGCTYLIWILYAFYIIIKNNYNTVQCPLSSAAFLKRKTEPQREIEIQLETVARTLTSYS